MSSPVVSAARNDARLLVVGVIVLGLLVIAVLVTANEIRYQGCVANQNQELLAHVKSLTQCSRLPFGA